MTFGDVRPGDIWDNEYYGEVIIMEVSRLPGGDVELTGRVCQASTLASADIAERKGTQETLHTWTNKPDCLIRTIYPALPTAKAVAALTLD
jgi:hypothetical protein